jgi:hypothetical protein
MRLSELPPISSVFGRNARGPGRGVGVAGAHGSHGPLCSPLLADSNGPGVRVHRLPDAQVEIELQTRCLIVGRDRVEKPNRQRLHAGALDLEAETPKELGQVFAPARVAELDLDAALVPLQLLQTNPPPDRTVLVVRGSSRPVRPSPLVERRETCSALESRQAAQERARDRSRRIARADGGNQSRVGLSLRTWSSFALGALGAGAPYCFDPCPNWGAPALPARAHPRPSRE